MTILVSACRRRRGGRLSGAVGLAVLLAGCAPTIASPSSILRVGAIFPLTGSTAADASDEYAGALIAAQMVNADGGAQGRSISLDVRSVNSVGQIPAAVASLRDDGVAVVIGADSSQLSIPAAAAVARAGMVYWETGAVADQVTGQGSPLTFRVGANGADLGGNSGRFVLQQLVPRFGVPAGSSDAFLVTADDAYAHSVAAGVRAALSAGGMPVGGEAVYNPYAPNWTPVIAQIATAKPAVLLLSSHVPDGVAFRREFLAAGLHVKAFIGTTMAQCTDFGAALGADAVGVFASDRPEYGFNQSALSGAARTLYQRFTAAWSMSRHGLADRGGHLRVQRRVGALRQGPSWRHSAGCPRHRQRRACARPAVGQPAQRGWVALLDAGRRARPERPRCSRHLAVAGPPALRSGVAGDVCNRSGRDVPPAASSSADSQGSPAADW